MNVRETVYDQVKIVGEEQSKLLPVLTDDMCLVESGMDSLCIAILIARLDDELSLSPFGSDDVEIPVTLGDLIRLYENAAENASA
jgi:acyl carrier protein